MSIYSDMRPDELPNPFNQIAQAIGVENTLLLIQALNGQIWHLRVPNLKNATMNFVVRKVPEEFNGANYAALATKYNYSETEIRRIIRTAAYISSWT
jgi:Mor family transcriptional regulator